VSIGRHGVEIVLAVGVDLQRVRKTGGGGAAEPVADRPRPCRRFAAGG